MKSEFLIYPFLAVIVVTISGHNIFASFPEAISSVYAGYSSKPEENLYGLSGNSSGSNVSAATDDPTVNDYLKHRYTELKPNPNGGDTIKKVSEYNNDLLKKKTLSTLKSKSENNFITRNLFALVVKDNHPYKAQLGVNSSLYFANFAGKEIGEIRIQQLDVFGPSLQDTAKEATGWIEKSGNFLHKKTTEHKLRMQLLFSSGEKINPQLMADNEKVIRDLPYIQDVAILLSHSKKEAGKVDIVVIVKERFEYGIRGSLGSGSSELEIIDQNMFGLGHQFSAKLVNRKPEKPNWGGSFKYEFTDLVGKFIQTGFSYTNTYRKEGWNAYLDKRFIASKVDWAGGISFERVFSDYYLTPYSYTTLDTAASYLNADIWYGRQFKSKNDYSSLGNITVAGRYLHQKYYNNPDDHFANSYFRDHNFVLGSIGISKRYLFKNNRIYGYGITEDIPYGRFAELAMGFDKDALQTRPYFHLRYSKANILKGSSYLKWQFGVGGYIGDSQVQQGVILLGANYFTNYIYINQSPYRFFVNLELLGGINRFDEEYLVINRKFGIRDFFSLDTKGTNRLKINIESVRFWGWNYYGFRFANYFFADGAFVSNKMRTILTDQFYGGIGLGIRVHNESLIFNVLEIRLSWIPIAPRNYDPFIFKSFGQPKAKFDDFLGGKPQEIVYQ